MPTPREAAQKYNAGSGEKSYCGVCGTPECMCGSYKEHGAVGATKAGSADTNDKLPMKEKGGPPSEKKEKGGFPFGKKE